jgi:monoamine oxidase
MLSRDVTFWRARRRQQHYGLVTLLAGGFEDWVRPRRGGRCRVLGTRLRHELRRAGLDVTVVEARNRVGGRVLTFRDWIPGKSIEGGAELIGSNHPTWLALARTFNLTFRPMTEDDASKRPVILNGEFLDETKKRSLFEDLDRVLGALTKQAVAVDADRPWLSPGANEIDARSLGEFIDQQSPDKLASPL